MEDILASIRRILSEDEAPAGATTTPAAEQPAAGEEGVLVLDPAMMVSEPSPPETPQKPADAPQPPPEMPPAAIVAAPVIPLPGDLLAPEAAAAAATSVEGLVKALTERTTRVRAGGPTIEDIVREEIRPMLKAWLDANLPLLVERLVRTEIERVVGRAVP
jgi:uncharacterized protein